MRIEEPFLKGHLALWLVAKGATSIRVSIDGAEPHPEAIRRILMDAGYSHMPSRQSKAPWTGRYEAAGRPAITVVSLPGVDIDAEFAASGHWVVECKGEPTPAGLRSGQDRTAFYSGLGQLIMTAGAMSPVPSRSILAIPNTQRLCALAAVASYNPYVQRLSVSFLTVDAVGQVVEV
jgi:hypothetical protein